MEEKKILVYYIRVSGVPIDEISNYIERIIKKIIPKTFVGEVIIIPTFIGDSRVECINPQYIKDTDLIKKHEDLMKKLNENLEEQSKLIKK